MNEKKAREKTRYIRYIFGGAIALFLVYLALLLFVGSDPIISSNGAHYEFTYNADGVIANTDSEIRIPAIVDENGNLIFSEDELTTLGFDCRYPDRSKKQCNRFNVSYVTTSDGTMISIRPRQQIDLANEGINFLLEKGDYRGAKISFSRVIDHSFLSGDISVPVFIDFDNTNISSTLIDVNLMECGYAKESPNVCRGYWTGNPLSFPAARGNIPVKVTAIGQSNEFARILRWPVSVIFNNFSQK